MTRETDENGRVIDPNELDITDDERVRELEDGRFVVSTDGPPNVAEDATPSTNAAGVVERDLSDRAVRERILETLAASDSTYAVELTAVVDDTPTSARVVTDDVVTGFEHLLEWYASAVGSDTPADDALGILLAEAEVPVGIPPSALVDLAEANGLGLEDSIADLVATCSVDGDSDDLDSHS